MKKSGSKLHIAFVIMMFIAFICFIVSLCLFDYNFNSPFIDVWQANMPSFILMAVFAVFNLILIISAIALRVKNDERTKSETSLAFQITAVLILEIVLSVPLFIVWIIQKIHDAVSNRKRENI